MLEYPTELLRICKHANSEVESLIKFDSKLSCEIILVRLELNVEVTAFTYTICIRFYAGGDQSLFWAAPFVRAYDHCNGHPTSGVVVLVVSIHGGEVVICGEDCVSTETVVGDDLDSPFTSSVCAFAWGLEPGRRAGGIQEDCCLFEP